MIGLVPGDCCGCSPVCSRTWTITGCSNYPLPGAVVTMTSTGGIITSGTTGSDGKVTLGHGATSGTYTVTHPSGRFNGASGSFSSCTGATTQGVQLFAASGYRCCGSLLGPSTPTPYPVSTSLTLTDVGGSQSVALSTLCDFTVCSLRPNADNYAADCSSVASMTCYDAYTGLFIPIAGPKTVGTGSIYVWYTLSSTSGGWQLSQGYYWCVGYCYWNGATCPPDVYAGNYTRDKVRYWRVPGNCSGTGLGGAGLKTDVSTGFTVNSLEPFNVTFHFAGGTGFGPSDALPGGVCTPTPTPLTGNPYSMDVTISG
ncbi:carboxypeptidase-like regulatory domain-containing protein [Paludisphaera rhizosphaerae]|uniref:carboxypeptidase-like regulatory domain-containing protein n=1 Tax=Paludisphaera rhizosphaerae TaxID=2711216 RepID=UPI0013E9F25E|nr:carboxypeptidase-like regulatory domain-containing protein [Paludisphaera rhizosphaerae]